MGREENAGNQDFLLFPECFLPVPKQTYIYIYSVVCKCFQFGPVQNLLFVKELIIKEIKSVPFNVQSTHVVCDNPEKADTSYKCRMAMKYGIPVVSPRYLQHSVDTGVLQKTDDFIMAGKSKSETLREGKITGKP